MNINAIKVLNFYFKYLSCDRYMRVITSG